MPWLPSLASLGIAALISACATGPQAVSVSCVKEPLEKPQTTDEAVLRSMDDYAATLTTWTERLTLKAYAEKAGAVIQACR